MYNSAMTKVFAAIHQCILYTENMIRTQMGQHAPEDSQSSRGLLVQPFESSTWKRLQVFER